MPNIHSNRHVGIITLPGDFNYGNKLQLYATMTIWSSLGYTAVNLSHRKKYNPYAHPKQLIKKALGKGVVNSDEKRTPGRAAAFSRFNELIPTIEVNNIDEVDPDSYTYFSVGSDQVWNPPVEPAGTFDAPLRRLWQRTANRNETEDWLRWYFLGFARREQRIAFAPSLCYEHLSSWQLSILARGVTNFDRLSVRETIGAEYITECAGMEATVLCDPTLLLTPEQWSAIADDGLTPKQPYVFAYVLGNRTDENELAIEHASEHGRIPVIHLSDSTRNNESDAGPAEFISLIANAEHVVTDSYHASIFSTIFERPLTIVDRQGITPMFSRLKNLTTLLGIEGKIMRGGVYDSQAYQEYVGVSATIDDERSRFKDYLIGCVDG